MVRTRGGKVIRTVGGHIFHRGPMLRRSARMLDRDRREMLRDVDQEVVEVPQSVTEEVRNPETSQDDEMDVEEREEEMGAEQGDVEAEEEMGAEQVDIEEEEREEEHGGVEELQVEGEQEEVEGTQVEADHVEVEEMETDERDNEVMQPEVFRINHNQWMKKCKMASRCDLKKTVDYIEGILNERELAWFTNHRQFRHYFHMPRHDNRRLMAMWMLLLREVETKKNKEVWFVINGVPIRYSLTEHALLSGLNCKQYPLRYEKLGSIDFRRRVFRGKKKIDVRDIKKKLGRMDTNGEDRLKVAILYFLATIIKMKSKVNDGYIEPFLLRIVDDLSACETFPWGRFSFMNIIEEVNHMHNLFNLSRGNQVPDTCTLPGFILPLEVLAYECIPQVGERFRLDVVEADKACPRLCKRMFKRLNHKGIALHEIYDALGTTKDIRQIVPTADEVPLLAELMEEHPEDDHIDPFPDSWTLVLEEGIFWKDLYEKDVATRAEFEEVVADEEADEEADGGADDGAAKNVVKIIKAFKKQMVLKFKRLEDKLRKRHEKNIRELKKEMKTLVKAESRKSTNGARRKSTWEKGECSRRTGVEDDDDFEEADDLETEEESEEEVEDLETEEEVEDFETDEEAEVAGDGTTMAQFIKRRRLSRK